MFKDFIIIRIIFSFIIPYITLYAIYIQLNGEISPGGGFQAGVIFATGLLAYEILFGQERFLKIISVKALVIISTLGVALYAATGLYSFISGDNYLNYNSLGQSKISGQHLGIFLVELGVGLTVSSVMCLIYSLLKED